MTGPLQQKYGRRAAVLLPLCLLIFVALSAWRMWPSGQPTAVTPEAGALLVYEGPTMGTTWRVKVAGAGDPAPILPAIEGVLAEVDRQMSDYRDDSAITGFNRHRATTPFPAPDALLDVTGVAADVSARTGGAFDVTIAPLVDAWGFGRPGPREAPGDAELERLRARVGWRGLHVDLSAKTLRKDHPELAITLSAIAPGYAADLISDRLVALGFPDHLVDVGGEFRARGVGPEGPWRLGIERPDGPVDARVVHEVVVLRDAALATSGDYRNYREQDGRRLSHTIDPRTGRPIEHTLASVTVITDTAARADALATALNVLGPDEGLAVAEREQLAALFLVREGSDFTPRASSAFTALRAASRSPTLSP